MADSSGSRHKRSSLHRRSHSGASKTFLEYAQHGETLMRSGQAGRAARAYLKAIKVGTPDVKLMGALQSQVKGTSKPLLLLWLFLF